MMKFLLIHHQKNQLGFHLLHQHLLQLDMIELKLVKKLVPLKVLQDKSRVLLMVMQI